MSLRTYSHQYDQRETRAKAARPSTRSCGILAVYVAGTASGIMTAVPALDLLIATFGPFLIPATLFVLGAVGYLGLWAVTRYRRETYTDDRR